MIKISYNRSLKEFNTFGLDVKAARFIEYDEVKDIPELFRLLKDRPGRILHIGRGSNLLFTKDFDGTILHSGIKYIHEIYSDDDKIIYKVGAGVVWDDFCRYAAEKEYYGTENLSYIPGEVGSASVQNIGAYGAEVSQVIQSVNVIKVPSGEMKEYSNSECSYAYRDSIFKRLPSGSFIVVSVNICLSKIPSVDLEYGQLKDLKKPGYIPTAMDVREKVISIRKQKLPEPSELGSAGSFFKNPVVSDEKFQELLVKYPEMPHYKLEGGVKIPAAYLIEQCGWKGKSLGEAAVYEKQPLIIVNRGNATPDDIIGLASSIRESVLDKFGIEIKPEVNYI